MLSICFQKLDNKLQICKVMLANDLSDENLDDDEQQHFNINKQAYEQS